MVKPDTGQANFWLKISRSADLPLFFSVALPAPASSLLASANSAKAMPSASFSACSSESASRVSSPGYTAMRSMTTTMSCLNFLSSVGGSLSS